MLARARRHLHRHTERRLLAHLALKAGVDLLHRHRPAAGLARTLA